MRWIYYLVLLVMALAGLLLTIMAWPGLWLMAAGAAAYALVTHGRYLGLHGLEVIFALTLAAELAEWILAPRAIVRAGGGRAAKLGATIGGAAGGMFLTLIPIPVLGTILGICLGAFLGAAGVELYGGRRASHALGVGWGAAKGRVVSMLVKAAVGCALLLLIIVLAWP